MSSFEQRLTLRLAALAAVAGVGCGGERDVDARLQAMCDGGPPVPRHVLAEGWGEVPPGSACPSVKEAWPEVHPCAFMTWDGATCGFNEVVPGVVWVTSGYQSGWEDAASLPAGSYDPADVVDLCLYDAVFHTYDPGFTCGRPLLQDGEPVVASVVAASTGWSGAGRPPAGALNRSERASVAGYWLACARLEHASVASFARFSLDLLRFGAPPELLAAAHRAALDEIDHARRCFALASRFHGAALGPGPLAVDTPGAAALADLAEAVVREGCVGETLAAIDAAARRVGTTDPEVSDALDTIVRDESAHAGLAWRTLAWLLDHDPDGALRRRADAAFHDERERVDTALAAGGEVTAAERACGLLGGAARAAELRRAWSDVIEPWWRALRARVA